MTNSFCCLYLLFSVSVPAPSSFVKMLDPCTHNVHVLHVLVYSLLHICDSMAEHWTTSPPCLKVVAPGHKEYEEPLAVSIPSHHWMENYSSFGFKVQVKTRRCDQ